jgi:hypothetical protein
MKKLKAKLWPFYEAIQTNKNELNYIKFKFLHIRPEMSFRQGIIIKVKITFSI